MSNEEKKSDLDSFWDEAYSREEEKELKKQMKAEAKRQKKEKKLRLKGSPIEEEETAPLEASAGKETAAVVEALTEEASLSAETPAEESAAASKETASTEEGSTEEESMEEDSMEEASAEPSEEGEVSDEEEPERKRKKKKKKKKGSEEVDTPEEDDSLEEGEWEKDRDPDHNIVKDLFSLIIYIGIVILICFLIITFVGQRTTVKGESMVPTLSDKDNLWIDKLVYRFHDPERFDIIVFPYSDDEFYIKRIIGLPGETIQIKDGYVYINGEQLDDPYGETPMNESGIVSSPILLRDNEYFVLGDNRNRSHDSRYSDVGFIKRDKITGKAVLRLTPLKSFGKLK